MKFFALIATSLSLLSAGVKAQEAAPATPQIVVTAGSVITSYAVTERVQKFTVTCTSAIYNQAKEETQFNGSVHFNYGAAFDVYAGKALVQNTEDGILVTLQSDGKTAYGTGKEKVTQLVASGTRIEIPSRK